LKKILALFLIVMALVAGAAFVACGGGDDEDKDGKATPAAQETKEGNGGEETPAAKATKEEDGGGGNGGGSLEDVPIYPGATKIGEWSTTSGAMAGAPMDLGEYSSITYAMFETDDSTDDVLDFYKDKMKDWNDEGTFSFGEGEEAMSWFYWTKDEGAVAAMVMVVEEGGNTAFTVYAASQ